MHVSSSAYVLGVKAKTLYSPLSAHASYAVGFVGLLSNSRARTGSKATTPWTPLPPWPPSPKTPAEYVGTHAHARTNAQESQACTHQHAVSPLSPVLFSLALSPPKIGFKLKLPTVGGLTPLLSHPAPSLLSDPAPSLRLTSAQCSKDSVVKTVL